MSAPLSHTDYRPGHSWYYRLGGRPLTPKQILAEARRDAYRGYRRDEIALAASRCEPRRSQELRTLRQQTVDRLRFDLARYRVVVHALRRASPTDEFPMWSDPFLAVGLKHSHLYNEFGHLVWIDELLSAQRDLFDC